MDDLDQPPEPKRIRRCVCMCPVCNGKERDYRTAERHAGTFRLLASINSDPDPSIHTLPDLPLAPTLSELPDPLTSPDLSHDFDISHVNTTDENTVQDTCAVKNCTITDQQILRYIYKELLLKLNNGSSQSECVEHLKNVSELLGPSCQLPTTWSQIVRMMEQHGYQAPRHYKVCVTTTHSFLLRSPTEHPVCPLCNKRWSDCIDYYVSGLGFHEWFSTEDKCKRLMAHWKDKESWFRLGSDDNPDTISEVWHGKRFRELSYFWDEDNSYLLPHKCFRCSSIINTAEIETHISSEDSSYICTISCHSCNYKNIFEPRYATGDCRNQAIFIHEDGWNSHSTSSQHPMAAITITHGCMSKLDRADSQHAIVYSFINVGQLPRDSPHKLDAFFQPLLEEIEDLYIEGQEIFFCSEVAGVSPEHDIATLRAVPLLITADSKAHAEIGLTAAGGRKGCRRCTVTGEYVAEAKHYYYGNIQYRHRFPAPPRQAETNREFGQIVDRAAMESCSRRKLKTKEYGLTGESIIFRLYDLCGFDPVYDLVIDVMHAVTLNLVKTELEKHLLGKGILHRKRLDSALKRVQWTTELKDGRVPHVCLSSKQNCHLGHWKSEDYSKFATVAPYVLHSLIPQENYNCFMHVCRIHQLLYNKSMRIHGWTTEDIDLLRSLLWKHAIEFERLYGLSACSENVEYSLHIPDDLSRHSTADNYWCYMYERQVRFYKRQKTNQKQLCKTFSDRASQLRFVSNYLDCNTTSQDCSDIHVYTPREPFLVKKTIKEAFELKDHLDSVLLTPSLKNKYKSGILIGTPSLKQLDVRQQQDVNYWIVRELSEASSHGPGTVEKAKVAYLFSKVLKPDAQHLGTVYRIGDYVVMEDPDIDEREWVMKVTSIFVCSANNKYYSFIDGDYFVAQTRSGSLQYDEWTNQPKMVPKHFERLRCQLLRYLKRKIMLYPDPVHTLRPSFYLVIDPTIADFSPVDVPYYPKAGEVVRVDCRDTPVVVERVNDQVVEGYSLKWVNGRNKRWITQGNTQVQLIDIIKPIPVRRAHDGFYPC